MVARGLIFILIFSLSNSVFGQTEEQEDSLMQVRQRRVEQIMHSQNYDSIRQIRFEMQQATAEERLEASLTLDRSAEELLLSNLTLTKLPKHISEFTNLQRLELQGNQLKTISRKVLKNVKYLDLSENPLHAQKFRFKKNKSITYLKLDKNQLERLPRSIRKLKALHEISIQENHFTTLPRRASKRKTLKTVDLTLNPINTEQKLLKSNQ
jgi:Leucine-rich repeat (LRR) protein